MSSIVVAGDTSGSVTLQAPAVAGSSVLTLPAVSGTVLSTGNIGVIDSGMLSSTAQYTGFKNRIINGGMVIDQRNAGAATANTINGYTVDRWIVTQNSSTGKLIAQQNAAAVTPPAGFTNYLGVTSQSSYSVGSTDWYAIQHNIEGYNVADLDYGKATAKTCVLSFWVRSSLTGTFVGTFGNSASTRAYPFTYTISVANTWEQKTITVNGDTSGTWLTTNGVGLYLMLSLGMGSSFQTGTANNSWATSTTISIPSGGTSVVGTSGATFYITGVQLEKGSVATSFDQRAYSQELAMCQRYYQGDILTAVGGGATPLAINRLFYCAVNFPVPFRATPTMTIINTITSINMNAGEWTQLDALRGYFQATNSVTNDCVLTAKSSGAAEL